METNRHDLEEAVSRDEYVDNPDDWDWDNPVIVEGKGPARSTFSVRLQPGELTTIGEAAQAAGMKTGEFIRNAALAAARGETSPNATQALVELATRCGMRVTFEPVRAPADERDADVA